MGVKKTYDLIFPPPLRFDLIELDVEMRSRKVGRKNRECRFIPSHIGGPFQE
jgi:hypothetical protein